MTPDGPAGREGRIIGVVARALDVGVDELRFAQSGRGAYARRLAAYVLWLDSGTDEVAAEAFTASLGGARWWRTYVRREMRCNQGVRRDLGRIARALYVEPRVAAGAGR